MTDFSPMDSAPIERTSQRHRRTVAIVALAAAAIALASAIYLHTTLKPQLSTPASTTGYLLASPPAVPSWPRLGGLLRPGATAVLIQQYGGLSDQRPLGLQASVDIRDSAAISRLVQRLNALPAYPSESMWCAYGDGSYFAVDLTYAGGSSITVRVESNGCRGVYFGVWEQPVAWAFNSPELFDTLRGLLAQKLGSNHP